MEKDGNYLSANPIILSRFTCEQIFALILLDKIDSFCKIVEKKRKAKEK
jgi:hypothetical protein